MYPADGGGDLYIEDSALGVLILWTTWFNTNEQLLALMLHYVLT